MNALLDASKEKTETLQCMQRSDNRKAKMKLDKMQAELSKMKQSQSELSVEPVSRVDRGSQSRSPKAKSSKPKTKVTNNVVLLNADYIKCKTCHQHMGWEPFVKHVQD